MRPSERQTLDHSAFRRSQPADERVAHLRPLPEPGEIRTRDLLGIPVAMTDYAQTMDVMDGHDRARASAAGSVPSPSTP